MYLQKVWKSIFLFEIILGLAHIFLDTSNAQ
jgi:hypothetical protein